MPELPEVETTRAGLEPHIVGNKIIEMTVLRRDLRWPITDALPSAVEGLSTQAILRRGKYLVFQYSCGVMLAHLGMSGSMRMVPTDSHLKKHDHWSIRFESGQELRYNDPRRFGALFWEAGDWQQHALISHLGPEPLGEDFDADYLFKSTRRRSLAIKNHIMDSGIVVGVGNIYAAESLFHARIHPALGAGKITKKQCARLVEEIKRVLARSIQSGGTTLRDYVNGNGQPGYFQQELWVYGREGELCKICETRLKGKRMGQRATVFCPTCQKR